MKKNRNNLKVVLIRAVMAACLAAAAVTGVAAAEYFEFEKTIDPRVNNSDFDYNGVVDVNDLAVYANDWLNEDPNRAVPGHVIDPAYFNNPATDLNYDGIVNVEDFAIFSSNWQWETPTGPVLTVYEVISGDDDPQGPDGAYFWGAYILTNVSLQNPDNQCMEVTFHAGVNQGIDYAECIWPDGWNVDDSDPNKTRLVATLGYRILPAGGQEIFELYSTHPLPTEGLITAKTVEELPFAPIKGVDLPK